MYLQGKQKMRMLWPTAISHRFHTLSNQEAKAVIQDLHALAQFPHSEPKPPKLMSRSMYLTFLLTQICQTFDSSQIFLHWVYERIAEEFLFQ